MYAHVSRCRRNRRTLIACEGQYILQDYNSKRALMYLQTMRLVSLNFTQVCPYGAQHTLLYIADIQRNITMQMYCNRLSLTLILIKVQFIDDNINI